MVSRSESEPIITATKGAPCDMVFPLSFPDRPGTGRRYSPPAAAVRGGSPSQGSA